jgi:hypothetical protein
VSIPARKRLHRAKLAAAVRHHPDDSNLIDSQRRELAALGLEDHVRRVVEGFPPLTAEQRDRLAALLRDWEATPA